MQASPKRFRHDVDKRLERFVIDCVKKKRAREFRGTVTTTDGVTHALGCRTVEMWSFERVWFGRLVISKHAPKMRSRCEDDGFEHWTVTGCLLFGCEDGSILLGNMWTMLGNYAVF